LFLWLRSVSFYVAFWELQEKTKESQGSTPASTQFSLVPFISDSEWIFFKGMSLFYQWELKSWHDIPCWVSAGMYSQAITGLSRKEALVSAFGSLLSQLGSFINFLIYSLIFIESLLWVTFWGRSWQCSGKQNRDNPLHFHEKVLISLINMRPTLLTFIVIFVQSQDRIVSSVT
jgi:hypothetical protein